MLSTIVVLGLIMSAVAFVIGPLLRSQSQTQAKTDTVQAAAMALYRLQRDVRNSTFDKIYTCTTGALPACTSPLTTLTPTSAIVITSAYDNGTGQFQLVPSGAKVGAPMWQGATVYWVDSVGNLEVGFDTPSASGYVKGNPLTPLQAAAAVTDVTAQGGTQLARFVEQLSIGVDPLIQHRVSLQLQAQSTVGGASNETTYRTDLETRN